MCVFASQSMFQTFTVCSPAARSRPGDAMRRPSGLTATLLFGLESCRISKLGFSAATAQTLTAGSEAPADIRSGPVRVEGQTRDRGRSRLEWMDRLSAGRVVEGDPVVLADSEELAVGAESRC